jgi:hypothetical protein
VRGRLKHRGTEARRKKEGGGGRRKGKGMVRRGTLCGLCGSVALCFYSPDRCADGGNTEARRHGERRKGKERGKEKRERGMGMVRRGALCGLCGSVFLFGARTQ